MSANGAYRAPRWLPGGHAQTIYPAFVRRPQVVYRRRRIDTPDGDFVDFDWLETPDCETPNVSGQAILAAKKADPAREKDCIFCRACEIQCPVTAIKITEP